MELQELLTRGRLIFKGARARLEVFRLVNGRNNARDIADATGRSHSNVLHDLRKLADVGLIEPRLDRNRQPLKKESSLVYEKIPLARTIPLKYFQDSIAATKHVLRAKQPKKRARRPRRAAERSLPVPAEQEIIDICHEGEDEFHEFKGPGTGAREITKKIAGFLHTRKGGLILYGVDDKGKILGTDRAKADLDESLQNSIRSNIDPAPSGVKVRSVNVAGTEILVIVVAPWNRRDVYHFEDRVYIRKGTNALPAKSHEVKRLHDGEYVE